MSTFPEHAVHKIVPLKFAGVDLKFKTSHALFSHHHVDTGTMLLLKTLAQRDAVPLAGRVLDAGCGYGALSLAVKKLRPALEVTARDRLALAAAFTAENARLNRVEIDAAPGLLLEDSPGPWDLILSNLPAKAGDQVLADFVPRSLSLLGSGGLVAVVIVETLAPWFAQQLSAAEVVYEESGPGYRVFHYRGTSPARPAAFPEVYRRGQVSWLTGRPPLTTYFGLPNFDTVDYRTQVSLSLLETFRWKGDALLWEPAQGHLAAWLGAQGGGELHLAGNDALGVAAAATNAGRAVSAHCVPFLEDLTFGTGSLGAAVVQVHAEPELPWVDATRDALLRIVSPGGLVLLNGTSTDLSRFLERHRGLRKVRDERARGWRAALLERQP